MIINNAGSRRDVDFWTKHLQNTEENDRAELRQIRGLSADNLHDALLEMQQDARTLPRLENFMYHADFNPTRDERLTEQQWERAFEIFEQQRGIPAGQPRVVFEHEKDGRIHRHVIWTRVDHENQRATPDGLDWKVAHTAAREIEEELGLQKVIGPLDREPGTPRPKRAPEPWEMYRGMKTKLDPRDIAAEVTELFQQSQNGKEFQAALEQHGYQLAIGDRGLLILDSAGKEHSLARRIDGIRKAELDAFMRDVDRTALPTLEQAKGRYQECKIDRLENEVAGTQKQIEAEQLAEIDKSIAAEFYDHWTHDPARFEKQLQIIVEQAPGVAREIEKLVAAAQREQDKQAADARIRDLAAVDKLIAAAAEREYARRDPVREDMAWHDAVAQAAIEKEKIEGRFIAPENVQRETRAGRMEKEAHQPEPKPMPASELGKTQGEIRLARRLSPGPQSFANAIEDRGFILARVTPDDIQKEKTRLREEWEQRRRNPQTWMEHEGGFAALSPELQASARRSFDEWQKEQDDHKHAKKPPLETYMDSVQRKWAEKLKQEDQSKLKTYVDFVQRKWLEGPKSQLERATGGLAVITPFESIYTLTPRNTGLDRAELPHYLKGIDSAALLSVTDAQAVMQEVREHHRKEWLARQPLGRTAGEIRLAYSLTQTGQQFANAIEDRGSILACMSGTDAERFNRWERKRLQEEWKAPAPEKTGRVQMKESGLQEFEKYRAGELVVVNQYGQIFQLTRQNTGDDDKARAEHLKDIDRAALLSVTAAQGVMRKFQQHRQEERRQAWQQQREEWLRPAREEYWPTNAPQPERKTPGLFQQAASEARRDGRTENLHGAAAQAWTAYRQSGNEAYFERTPDDNKLHSVRTGDREAFAAALDSRGIAFAIVTKEEADRSHTKEAAFARAVGNYAPRYKEGEIVLVTEPRHEYRRDGEATEPRRVHKLDQSLAEKFVKALDNRSQLKGIEATKQALDERAQKRAADWHAIRLENATNIKNRTAIAAADLKKGVHKSAYVAGNVLDGLGKGFHALSSAFDSLISPKLSPEQIYEGEKAKITREAEAEHSIDFSRYTADRAQERHNQKEQQAARDRQREIERER